ncbi:MAG: ACT domain-containing protein [archaeon]
MKEDFNKLKIRIDEEDYAVVRTNKIYSDAFANIKHKKEITVIIDQTKIHEEDIIEIEKDWKLITFDTILGLSLVGFVAKISEVLAKEKMSIFVLSSYFTDHVLVKKKDLDKAVEALNKLGVKVKKKY